MFWKKKKMVDVRELHKRGIVNLDRKDVMVPTDKEGYVELGDKGFKSLEPKSKKINFSFYGNSNSSSSSSSTGSSSSSGVGDGEGYSKREIDARLERLDNTLYKLEQRLEVLERKLGVNSPSSSDSSGDVGGAFGAMGW